MPSRLTHVGAVLLAASLLLVVTNHAHAAPSAPDDVPVKDVSPATRAASVAAAAGPGVVVHGLGHFARGDAATGRKLLALELAGLGALGVGGTLLVTTGASRRLVMPAAALSLAGGALFVTSYLADVYGTATAGENTASQAPLPRLQTEGGIIYVHDALFSSQPYLVQAVDVRVGRLRLRPEGAHAFAGNAERLRAGVDMRLAGAAAEAAPALDLVVAASYLARLPERFRVTTGELALRGRADLSAVAPSLRGAFVEGWLGAALAATRYATGRSADVSELLLGGFAYGVVFGSGPTQRGEAALYYDHRHDGFAAGMKAPGLGSGVLGHVGLRAHAFGVAGFGLGVRAEAGSALLGQLMLLYRVDP